MSAADILKLIEAADPANKADMREIDARVWCFLNGKKFICSYCERFFFDSGDFDFDLFYADWDGGGARCYATSRDALTAIRPEGWVFGLAYRPMNGEWVYGAFPPEYIGRFTWIDDNWEAYGHAKSETLAELSVIIQAIEHERTKA